MGSFIRSMTSPAVGVGEDFRDFLSIGQIFSLVRQLLVATKNGAATVPLGTPCLLAMVAVRKYQSWVGLLTVSSLVSLNNAF